MTDVEEGRTAVKSLLSKGCGCVVLTMGGSGVVFTDNGKIIHVPAEKVDVVDTTVSLESIKINLMRLH